MLSDEELTPKQYVGMDVDKMSFTLGEASNRVVVIAVGGETVWEGEMEEYAELLYALQNARRISLPKHEILLYRRPE